MGLFGKKKKPVSIVAERWNVYSYTYGDDHLAVISFDVDAATEAVHQGYGHGRRLIVYIPTEHVLANGCPVREENERLAAVEDDLIQSLTKSAVDCKNVGRMTYGAMREFVFQVADPAAFDRAVATWQQNAVDKTELREYEGWDFFDRKIRPERAHWQQIGDRQVIDGLLKAGSNPEKPHLLEHVFIGPQEKLQIIARQLGADDFTQVAFDEDRLVMSKASTLNLHEVSGLTGALLGFAGSLGVTYDGWGAMVVA